VGVQLNGKLIKEIRKADGLRQEDLLRLCEASNDTSISERSLRNAEAGKNVGADIFTRLAKVLRVDPADQLLKDKGLTLRQLRRIGQNGEPATNDAHPIKKPAEGITRVTLDLQPRRQLRLHVLEAVTPESGMKLPRFGLCFHKEEIKTWPRSAFEGFLSACLYYLKNSIRPADETWDGDQHAIINSTLMGKHVGRVWGTGEEDAEIPSSVSDHEMCMNMWNRSDLLPTGTVSELMHCYCPACEVTSFYFGWRELCLWLTSNGVEDGLRAQEQGRTIPMFSYMESVLQMLVTYLNKYEGNTVYGQASFWTMVGFFLQRELGERSGVSDERIFAKYHDYPMQDMWDGIRQQLEFNDEMKEDMREFVSAYSDWDTGLEAGVLKLQTEFIYTGKPHGELAEIKASRHP
jgi:transcriptional regulator with XRE-family HTH domain